MSEALLQQLAARRIPLSAPRLGLLYSSWSPAHGGRQRSVPGPFRAIDDIRAPRKLPRSVLSISTIPPNFRHAPSTPFLGRTAPAAGLTRPVPSGMPTAAFFRLTLRKSYGQNLPDNKADGAGKPGAGSGALKRKEEEAVKDSSSVSVSRYFHLPHLPQLPHRPTKEELLAAATGFWHRLKIRFKWVSIRSMRPWNADEWGAFVSWFFLGHIVWILVGTTTFMSLVIFSINTVFAQETLARWVGDYLTKSAGVTVVFESAIVPKWGAGVISFRNVFVSRRPGQVRSSVVKGSSANAAAVAAAERLPEQHEAAAAAAAAQQAAEEDDGNYTQFDLTIATVNVTLSLLKWWNGRGLLEDVEVKGVRGVVDRTSVRWSSKPVDPYSYRYQHQPGDFEIDSFRLEDLLVTVCQPNGFRPFPVSIYSCDMSRLRKRWLFYDFLAANHMSGSFDGSLFTIHPRQLHSPVIGSGGSRNTEGFQKLSRLRIDGLGIDHLNRGVEGPFGWIYEGNVDIVADVMFPADADEGIGKVMSDFYEEMLKANRERLLSLKPEWYYVPALESACSEAPIHAGVATRSADEEEARAAAISDVERKYLVMDLRMHLNDVKAAVPFLSTDILVRPIVAYINSKKTYIPITCRIVKRAGDFDGSWTIFDCGLMSDMSAHAYEAFARDVEDQRSRVRRLKKVGLWTLSVALHAVFMGMAGQGL